MTRAGPLSVPCMWMRGGTSKGGYFLKDDLPADAAARDAFLLRIMGSPDLRQIDGMGGADPLTSKVVVVSKSARAGIDVDYLFLQVFVDQAIVTDAQNCGNILAWVGPSTFWLLHAIVSQHYGISIANIYAPTTSTVHPGVMLKLHYVPAGQLLCGASGAAKRQTCALASNSIPSFPLIHKSILSIRQILILSLVNRIFRVNIID